ncbi:uncharacterized protein PODANS_4_445 [Podospora anserina S mat+]|uniref:Podospora anserina S mat+ genomic DNA chromosome 4, supercontig 1 n=1 Tax=Podospora anserina (strain S / ATCC MYA-4624 / DSM 980 / FGSC 10383) TaxID=515849 RepID=B2AD92_PODAN|nr:uncharacterized protein PODANS_4_445 [Podospora anserina S mat+]CAP61407.1 unnamed protein product [Podospora anserina S mat+]CDP27762.1 Putative protein of unknown function [Podospora anserina S mat+]
MLARRSAQADQVAEAELTTQVQSQQSQSKSTTPSPNHAQQQQEGATATDHHHRRHHHQWHSPHTGILSEVDVLNQMRLRSRSSSRQEVQPRESQDNQGSSSTEEVRERQAENGKRINNLTAE